MKPSKGGTNPDDNLRAAVAAYHPNPSQTGVDVKIPARQPYEGKATQKQKDLLWRIGVKDTALLDSLGKWQASAVIDQMKAGLSKGGSSDPVGAQFGILLVVIVVVFGGLLLVARLSK